VLFNVLFDRDESDEQANDFFDAPHMRGNSCFHRRRHPQCLMHPSKVVVHEVQGHHCGVILGLL
jgi:hypothetical protein